MFYSKQKVDTYTDFGNLDKCRKYINKIVKSETKTFIRVSNNVQWKEKVHVTFPDFLLTTILGFAI